MELTIGLNDHVIWKQSNKVNVNYMDCGRWNEQDGLWTEGNMDNKVWMEGNEMKHEIWSP